MYVGDLLYLGLMLDKRAMDGFVLLSLVHIAVFFGRLAC